MDTIEKLFAGICHCTVSIRKAEEFATKVREEYSIKSSSMTTETKQQFAALESGLRGLGEKAQRRIETDNSMGIVEKTIQEGYAEHYALFSLEQ